MQKPGEIRVFVFLWRVNMAASRQLTDVQGKQKPRHRPGLGRFAVCRQYEPQEGAEGECGRLFFWLKFEALAFKALCFCVRWGAAARAFLGTVAAAVTAAALSLANGRVYALAKIISRCRYAQNNYDQLGIHASPSCSRGFIQPCGECVLAVCCNRK